MFPKYVFKNTHNNTINSLKIHFQCQIGHSKVTVQQDSS